LTAYVYGTRAGDDLWFHVRVQDRQGRIVTETNTRPWNGGTTAWTVGELAPAMLDIPLPSETPNDSLLVSIATADSASPDDRLSFVPVATIAQSDVASSRFHPLYAEFDNKLAIEGYRVAPRDDRGQVEVQPGQSLNITLYFQAAQPIFENLKVFLHLIDDHGTVWAQHDDLAGEIQHPSGSWRAGEFVKQDFSLALPSAAPAGRYRIEVGAYRPDSGQRLVVAGTDRPVVDNAVVLSTTVRANAQP